MVELCNCVLEVSSIKVVLNVREIERRKDQSIDELTTLIDTCAKLTSFLRHHAFVETRDAIPDSVQRELDSVGVSHSDKQTQVVCDGLRRFLATYTECLSSKKQHKVFNIHSWLFE